MISRSYIRNNITTFSILLFIILFSIINVFKPSFIYNKDGSFRQFGLNSTKKTVIPIWLVTILLGIISYFFVLYYLTAPKLMY
jgi:hypothetical protein